MIAGWFGAAARVFAGEWRLVLRDVGVLLFFVALPLFYPIVYTLIYNPEVVRQLPVAVVDNSRTPESRQLIQSASGCPAVQIYSYDANMADAKARMADGQVFAIMEIPSDYADHISDGTQATVPMYFDMTLLIRYRALLSAMTDLQIKVTGDVTAARVQTLGASSLGISMPVNSESNFIGDTQQGFASFVIPGILILILQQSMVLGVMLIEGSVRDRRRRNGGTDPLSVEGVPLSATIVGKVLCYLIIYIPMTIYALRFVPWMFSLPHIGNPVDYLLFVFPMLIASALFGFTLSYFARERESTFMVVVFTSVVFLFLSGLTWPRYAMSEFWQWAGNLVPAVWGVEGFIRINSNAATLADSIRPYTACWILAAVYAVTAWLSLRFAPDNRRVATGSSL